MGEIISIYRVKTIATAALAVRFATVEKVPPKARELRARRPESRFAGHEMDAAAGFGQVKFAYRLRKSAKLRFFRVFKLLDEQKAAPGEVEASQYRSVAERIRRIRWMRRL